MQNDNGHDKHLEYSLDKLKRKFEEWGGEELKDQVQSYIRSHPWKSVGIAAGTGLFLGLIFKSGGRKDA